MSAQPAAQKLRKNPARQPCTLKVESPAANAERGQDEQHESENEEDERDHATRIARAMTSRLWAVKEYGSTYS